MPAIPHRLPFLALWTAAAAAQAAPPPIPVELRARFGFEGPRIVKVGDGIADLRIGDLDGDGRPEVVVADARRARLVALRIDGDETRMEIVPTRGQIAGYALADVHGDGRSDLLVVDGRGRLTVQHPGREPGAPLDLGLGGRGLGLWTGDLDGDGKADLVVAARGSLRWVTRLATEPRLSPIEPLEDNLGSLHLVDVDGDGRLDLVGAAASAKMNLRLRLGRGDGTFGPWRIAGVDNLLRVFPARLAAGGAALATIEGPHRRVVLRDHADHGGDAPLEWWAFGEGGQGPKQPPFAIGDVDGDGDDDVVVVQAERAQLTVYEWRDGTFVAQTAPTLAGVASVAIGDVDGDGRADLVLASPEEETLAVCSGKEALTRFPVQIACVDKPVAVAVHPQGGVLVLARDDKREAHLDLVVPGAAPTRLVDLGRLPADPVRLLVADLGDADGLEAAFVVPGEGLRTVTLGAGTKKVAKGEGLAGFTKKMEDGALALCLHEGRPALFAVRERFVRRFRVDAQGQLQVLTQDNGPAGLAGIDLAAELADGAMLYLDKKNDKLVRTRPGAPAVATEVPPFDFTRLVAHGDAALLVGGRGLLRVPFGSGPSLRAIAVHEPPTDRTFYWHGEAGDFDHDGQWDLLLIDRRLPGVQILAGGDGRLDRALAVPVFETPPSNEPDNEPRELATGDLDGDGRTDFVLLAHDRVMIYLQQK
ncbi:MAG: VCBS repeat-containing protein [Planctomycetes bacterium]|nr:VCBS repeat-containing protein [Planctomycetota bacterium]